MAASRRSFVAITGLVALFAAVAVSVNVLWLRHMDALPGGPRLPWWTLAAMFGLVEVFVIHLERGRQTHTFSVVEIPIVMGMFLAAPGSVVIARILGAGTALALHRRQPPAKLAFNLGMFSLETSLALLAFRALVSDSSGIGPRSWVPAFVACVLLNIVGSVGVTAVIALTRGVVTRETLRQLVVESTLLGPLANTSVALCVTVLLWFEPAGAVLMIIVAAVLVLAYRGYSALRGRYANLTRLYEFTQQANGHDGHDGLGAILAAARRVMGAARAELLVMDDDGCVRRVALDDDRIHPTVATVTTDELEPFWSRVLAAPAGIVAAATGASPELRAAARAMGWRDCLAVALPERDGVMAVANRVGDVATFDTEDLTLFNALVSHAVVSLDNARLLARLQHEAMHDALTGLPNRAMFNRAVEGALASRVTGEKVAVLLMDLDRFKDVNDTLGHHHGDRLLAEVGRRLQAAMRPGATVARLGGDEFAVLLPPSRDVEGFHRQALELSEALRTPFDVGELNVDAQASIGIALCPDHGEEPMALLQRADIAMYAAKASRVVEIYSPARDEHSRRRLSLVSELRAALEREEIEVWYQPQADSRTGAISTVEALVRWRHPTRGLLPPDEFIPVAEHTGLIGPLAAYVVERASRRWAQWHDAGLPVKVAVNLSTRNLQEPSLAERICAQLASVGMPPSELIVEITESAIMTESADTLLCVNALAAAGIGISVDDFGTGYSSFTHLRHLPVREIKVDKSFVMHMANDHGAAAIVRSVLDLGRNLGLSTVAEGVDSLEAWQRLAAWGCDRLQGYYLAKPLPPSQVTSWMMDRPAIGALDAHSAFSAQ